MKKLLLWKTQILIGQFWALPVLLLAGAAMGLTAAGSLSDYAQRLGRQPDTLSAFAYAIDLRNVMGVTGALWALVCLGLDFEDRGLTLALGRGFSRGKVFAACYALFLLGCALCSLVSQLCAVGRLIPELGAVMGGGYLLRCLLLRMAMDMGMMAVPTLAVYIFRRVIPAMCLACLYGFALFIAMGPHYALWIPEMYEQIALAELWPLAGLILSPALCYCVWRRADIN